LNALAYPPDVVQFGYDSGFHCIPTAAKTRTARLTNTAAVEVDPTAGLSKPSQSLKSNPSQQLTLAFHFMATLVA
jgi:hypothetical protein